MIKLFVYALTFTCLLLLTACGEDTSAPTRLSPLPHTVIVTFGLQGSSATTVGSVDLDVLLPPGFVLETNSSGDPTARSLTFLVDGAMSEVNYTGAISAKIIRNDGFPGNADLMQISCFYPANSILPTAESFTVTAVAYDLTPAATDISSGIRIDVQLTP